MAKKKHVYIWQCCRCGQSSVPIRSASCPRCGYVRCAYCSASKVQVGTRGSTRGAYINSRATLSRITTKNGHFEHWIPCYVNSIPVAALPDNCSAENIISEQFACQNKLAVDFTRVATYQLPDGTSKLSSGSLQLALRFADETTIFELDFIVLKECICNVVLGNDFLQDTGTFTARKQRIWREQSMLRLFPRVCMNGSPKQRITGSINDQAVSAFPDTGSDVNVVSQSYATFLQLDIDTGPESLETLVVIDGSTMNTCGIVRDVKWKFGSAPTSTSNLSGVRTENIVVRDWIYGSDADPDSAFICDFYVVEELSCQVILCADLLYGTNAFTACAEYFHDNDRISYTEGNDSICVMKRKLKEWSILSKFKTASCSPSHAQDTSRPEVAEAQRRRNELDRISTLPVDEQATAHEAERLRQEQWAQAQTNPT